ncbi:MAG TPA: AsmA family protein [Chthoniobacterales bacterium]
MHRISKLILTVAASLLGLVVMSFVGANLYLQSSEVQNRIRTDVERAIGAPLQVYGTSLTPWSGLTLSNLAVFDPQKPDTLLFKARSMNAKLNWWLLLSGRVEVTSVTLNEPLLIVESGRGITLPSPRQEIPGGAPPPSAPVEPAPATNAISSAEPKTPPRHSRPLRIAVKRFALRNGMVVVKDPNNRHLVEIHGLSADSQILSETDVRGTLQAEEIFLAQHFVIRHAKADYTFSGEQLNLSPITAELAQGAIKGIANVQTVTREASIALTLDQAQVPTLLEEAGLPSEGSRGVLAGNLELAGILGKDETYAGQGAFSLTSGTLQPLDFIRKVGEVLQIDELQLLQLETASLRVAIGHRRTQIEELVLKSKNLILSGTGPVRFDGRLNLNAQLKINEKLQRNLQGLLNRNFTESDLPGYKQLTFKITGTLSKPNTDDLLEKLTGIRGLSGEVGNFLQGLFRKPKPSPSPKSSTTP